MNKKHRQDKIYENLFKSVSKLVFLKFSIIDKENIKNVDSSIIYTNLNNKLMIFFTTFSFPLSLIKIVFTIIKINKKISDIPIAIKDSLIFKSIKSVIPILLRLN